MNFIIEFYTVTGKHRIIIQAASYREVEMIALQEIDKRDGILSIRCIREIPLLKAC